MYLVPKAGRFIELRARITMKSDWNLIISPLITQEMETNLIIGIDVSKSNLDYVTYDTSQSWSRLSKAKVIRISNEIDSIVSLLAGLDKTKTLLVFEPTGSYSDKLLSIASDQGYRFCLANPYESDHFSKSLGISNKTDEQSARMLAYMAKVLELPLYQAPSRVARRRKRALTTLQGLLIEKQRLKNQIHAQEQYADSYDLLTHTLKELLEIVEQKITILEKELKQMEDDPFIQAQELAMSVKGIGKVTSSWLITITDGFRNFSNPRQAVKYFGLSPSEHRSGSSVRKKQGVSKQATAKIRASLFMAARSAIRYNKACAELYQRLRNKGKSFYLAIVAVMAKLVKQVFAVVKSKIPFDNEYYLKFKKF